MNTNFFKEKANHNWIPKCNTDSELQRSEWQNKEKELEKAKQKRPFITNKPDSFYFTFQHLLFLAGIQFKRGRSRLLINFIYIFDSWWLIFVQNLFFNSELY